MAAVWTIKQQGFVTRYTQAVQTFLAAADQLALLNAEFTTDAYGTGGANALTDTVVEAVLPALTAVTFAEAEGAMVTILAGELASNRGYLEICRP